MLMGSVTGTEPTQKRLPIHFVCIPRSLQQHHATIVRFRHAFRMSDLPPSPRPQVRDATLADVRRSVDVSMSPLSVSFQSKVQSKTSHASQAPTHVTD